MFKKMGVAGIALVIGIGVFVVYLLTRRPVTVTAPVATAAQPGAPTNATAQQLQAGAAAATAATGLVNAFASLFHSGGADSSPDPVVDPYSTLAM